MMRLGQIQGGSYVKCGCNDWTKRDPETHVIAIPDDATAEVVISEAIRFHNQSVELVDAYSLSKAYYHIRELLTLLDEAP